MTSRQWKRQILAIMRIDLAKTFFAKRGLWIYLLALAPVRPDGRPLAVRDDGRNRPAWARTSRSSPASSSSSICASPSSSAASASS